MASPENMTRYDRLLSACAGLPPASVAVVHPCDESSLEGALAAERHGIIKPVLVGPRAKILAAAQTAGLDLGDTPIDDAPHSDAAADAAVELVREGQAEALMKGSLHTDELMARGRGARPACARRGASAIASSWTCRDTRMPLIITDAAVNIAPTLEDKVDIVQNAIDLAHALRFEEVRVAILSAMETVNPDVPSTIEAAALCKMADRGQITGAHPRRPAGARQRDQTSRPRAIKKIDSPVAGRANVLIVPDLEAGNMLAKSLSFLAGADAAGIVLGARVPIILTSRADCL